MQRRTVFTALAAVPLGLLLAGCAALDTVAVDVSSQSQWPVDRKPGTYAIERLPSQQANAAEQERIEVAALQAIEGAGFSKAPIEQADFLIQVGARAFEVASRDGYYGYGSPFYWRNDWWYHGYRRPFFYGPGAGFYAHDYYDYRRETAILVRDRRTQQIVYETRATHQSRWSSDDLLPVLFSASMKDFPTPAISPRTVTMALPARS